LEEKGMLSIREALFAVTFLADRDFNKQEFCKVLINVKISMDYRTDDNRQWGAFDRGLHFKPQYDETTLKKYYPDKELYKYIFFVGDLRVYREFKTYDFQEYQPLFDKECQDIYTTLFFAVADEHPDIIILSSDIPIEQCGNICFGTIR
jgi:hypothetical protein